MKASTLRRLINLWPPLLFSGIRLTHMSPDFREADVRLRLGWYNRNYKGVQFGGSLFAMTDPFYMLMLHHALGDGYVVWDKAASIEFVTPGKTAVTAHFRLDDGVLADIRDATAANEKHLPEFAVEIVDTHGTVVARVRRTVYVRRKRDETSDA